MTLYPHALPLEIPITPPLHQEGSPMNTWQGNKVLPPTAGQHYKIDPCTPDSRHKPAKVAQIFSTLSILH
eukprot:4665981-Ditylum_brightwellii.AAC.1